MLEFGGFGVLNSKDERLARCCVGEVNSYKIPDPISAIRFARFSLRRVIYGMLLEFEVTRKLEKILLCFVRTGVVGRSN
jgi:hypothetical protein